MTETEKKIGEILDGTFMYGKQGTCPFIGVSREYRIKQIMDLIQPRYEVIDEVIRQNGTVQVTKTCKCCGK